MKYTLLFCLAMIHSINAFAAFPDSCRLKIAKAQQYNFQKVYEESGNNLRLSSPQLYDVTDDFLYKNISSYFALKELYPVVEKGGRRYSSFTAYKTFENHFWQSDVNEINLEVVSKNMTRVEFWAASVSSSDGVYYYQAQFSYDLNETNCTFSNLKISKGREIYNPPAFVPF